MPDYIAVSRTALAGKRWLRPSGYAFAAQQNVIPLVAAEFAKAAMHLPLAFVVQDQGFQPVSITGLATGNNLFVTSEGRWQGNYIPAALRAYPFQLAANQNGQQLLCIDAESGLITDQPAGEAFFDEDGTPSAATRQMLGFLEQLEANRAATTAACVILQAQQLIVPWEITVQNPSGTEKLAGLYKVDETRLNALPDADFISLRQSGALPLAYCQLLSMQHLSTLGQLAQIQAKTRMQTLAAQSTRELDLSFLSQSGTFSFGNTYL